MNKHHFKTIALIFLSCIHYFMASSQNLVPNPGFETYTVCPSAYNAIPSAVPWTAASVISSTDYFNTCSPASSGFSVPGNIRGAQHARTGNAYAGLTFYSGGTSEGREYLQVQLISPLVQGKAYHVEFFVSKADYYPYAACNNIAANFSVVRPVNTIGYLQALTPHIMNPGNPMISDTVNWVPVSGCYVAQGGEEFLTIGNFFDNAHSQVFYYTGYSGLYNYCYVDDVTVEETTAGCTTGMYESFAAYSVQIQPNPSNGIVQINSIHEMLKADVLNIEGQCLLSETIHTKTYQFHLESFAEGIYFLKVTYDSGMSVTKKVIVSR